MGQDSEDARVPAGPTSAPYAVSDAEAVACVRARWPTASVSVAQPSSQLGTVLQVRLYARLDGRLKSYGGVAFRPEGETWEGRLENLEMSLRAFRADVEAVQVWPGEVFAGSVTDDEEDTGVPPRAPDVPFTRAEWDIAL